MRVAFLIGPDSLPSSRFSGVVVQARSWKAGLEALGVTVDLPVATEEVDWAAYDVIHAFQHGPWCEQVFARLSRSGQTRLVLSPIIDPPTPYGRIASALSRVPFERVRLLQRQRLLRQYAKLGVRFLARSRHEEASLVAVGATHPVDIVRIPIGKDWRVTEEEVVSAPRNGQLLHVSHLNQPRKNVRRLIEATVELGATLRLAGSISDPQFLKWIQEEAKRSQGRLVYLGKLTDEQLRLEMLACSVFCLPSLYEGVGLVALEAGYCGARVIVTDKGGSGDYFEGLANYANPTDVSSIRSAVSKALSDPAPDVKLHRHVAANFTNMGSAEVLLKFYRSMLSE